MNEPIYLDLPILENSETLMHEFWYDYIKTKYRYKAKLCYMDTGNFVIHIKTEDIYKDFAYDVKEWYDTSYHSKNDKRPLPIDKNKKTINFFKDELGGKIMEEFVGLRAKTYAYLMNDDNEHKKRKRNKKVCIKDENYVKNL